MKYYVTMTDQFMSGWGRAQGKINKLVISCESLEEAEKVASYAEKRGDQKYINITNKIPYYNSKRYLVQVKDKNDYPHWYKNGCKDEKSN